MRPIVEVASAAAVFIAATAGCALPSARASVDPVAINGVFTVLSDGEWATTDYAFHKEATVVSTWTITSTCTTEVSCTGLVSSDQGWEASLYTNEGNVWYVERDLPNWQPCPDGSVLPGHQTFKFYPSDSDGLTQIGSPYLEGIDKTVGERYACGRVKALTIVLPLRLNKIN
ncbi:hypothetical protein [Mycolicibacterium sp. P9-22]|uniref:hypothetical protein n=1 Tax=Mycolicibacterium sp. P9-22 TaxID=2024613 RepID=UPI001D14D8B3|nr:hypothetical protein [Mycolicibacterium sp. P9-22]